MAGHSKFSNIKHRKGAQDAKRAKVFTKVQREIFSAVKAGGDASEEFNPRLRLAILKAKSVNMPKDKIDSAINKAVGSNSGENFDEMRYDCYGPAGVGVIVETLTDNKNRTAGEIRPLAIKYGGNMGETGSLDFVFAHVGVILYEKNDIDFNILFEKSVDFGAENVEEVDGGYEVTTLFEDFHKVQWEISQMFGSPVLASIQYIPVSYIDLPSDKVEAFHKFIDALEDLDDVQNVWHAQSKAS